MKALDKYIKISAYISLGLLIMLLIPLMIMGFFTHPVGDDYLYGEFGKIAVRESGNFFSVFSEAFKGTLEQYRIWQGTYSAMFLMYLPPNLFGDFFYKLYPSVILLCLCGGLFFMLKPLITGFAKSSNYAWITVSSVISILFIEQVPLCGETFYWYNGSMYYTGFLVATFVLFGLIFYFLKKGKKRFLAFIIPLAAFISGGNYASLLPALIVIFLITIYLYIKKDAHKASALLVVFLVMTLGLLASVLAPGNSLRAAQSVGTSPVKAIVKSIIQCANYALCWNSVPVFVGFVALTPVFADIAKKSGFKFKYSPALIPLAFLIFCSSETAVFYGQNNGGPARLFDICFYMMIVTDALIYFVVVSFLVTISKKSSAKKDTAATDSGSKISFSEKSVLVKSLIVLCVIFCVTIPFNFIKKAFVVPNSVTATVSLVNSDAAYYESQYKERMNMIAQNPGGDLVFKTYDVPENLNHFLFVGDISDDPSHFVNQSFARFHNINSVYTAD